MRIDLIGPIPPPLGGVSVHLMRLAHQLAMLGEEVVRHGPQQQPGHFAYHASLARAVRGADIIHLHTHGLRDLLLLSLTGRIHHNLLWTVHGDVVRGQFSSVPMFAKPVAKNAIRSLAAIVAVNNDVAQHLRDIGVDYDRIFVISPFIPPIELELNQPACPELEQFCHNHDPILSAAAFSLADYGQVALYGIDLAIEATAKLCQRFPTAGLVVHLAKLQGDDRMRLSQLHQQCRMMGVDRNVLFLLDSVPFGPTLRRSRVLLRPTASDGDAVTVREALHLGVAAIASDVVTRPEGTIVFRHRDVDDLTTKLIDLVQQPQCPSPRPQPDATGPLLQLYRTVLS